MTKVLLDDVLRGKLLNLREPLELCDTSGNVLGRVTPVVSSPQVAPAEPQLSEEELQRREQEEDFSTEEVLGHLESL